MKEKYLCTILLLLLTTALKAQSTVDKYILKGLDSNQSIRQQGFLLEKNQYLLQEAKSLFLPSLAFNTTYTKAAGGRTIDFPLGDLFNPAYATLNKLTGTNNFPQLSNQHILLNADNFYDAKVHTSVPLLNAELIYNKRIKQQQTTLQQTEIALFKRELVKDIKNAYYQYGKAYQAVAIYESSLKLVKENRRINEALYNNQKINRTAVTRSENEISKIGAQLIGARESLESARSYFNFLLNKPLKDSIEMDSITALPDDLSNQGNSVETREELAKIRIARGIGGNLTSLSRSFILPKIGAFVDLGSQAFDWKFNHNSRYYLFGVSLEWTLFSSGKNSYRIKESIADQHSLEAENDYVEKQLQTQLSIAKNAYQSSVAQYNAAQTQLQTAYQYYSDELKMYKEGQALYIELLDAQNQLINARLESNIALYDAWTRYADIERANASFNLN